MRYTVELREHGGDWSDVWYTNDARRALRFAELAAATMPKVAAARVVDAETGAVVDAEEEQEQ